MLSILRIPNLLLLFISQLVLALCVVYPALNNAGIQSKFGIGEYVVLILILIAIAVGGYLYNDLKDIETDRTNKKTKTVGWSLSKQTAKLLFIAISLAPIPFVHFFSFRMGSQSYSLIYYSTIGLLFVYNEYLKKYAFIGNLLVAVLCGASTLLVYIAEYQPLQLLAGGFPSTFDTMQLLIFGFASFAFIINLNREIVKDILDLPGDTKSGYKTLPILFTIDKIKVVLIIVQVQFLLISILWIVNLDIDSILIFGGIILLVLPGLYIGWKIFKSKSPKNFEKVSYFLKLQILLGLVYLTLIAISL